ncbi:ankyrin repeat-containing protein ITN1-like [Cryptomeria japonica]|uniref:ankyrin repeat-containing protein ITN1-like n=1 Tax=Cryptomeria japonica TaxID=3369 RepID=UPI0027DA5B87|nr:ankyrin repeat-containing protein ITN1-like [Cryptomeria japonica]
MATESQQVGGRIDPKAFNAAVTVAVMHSRIHQLLCRTTERPSLREVLPREVLSSITPDGENTLLHLAASVGNLKFVEELLKLNPPLVNAINAEQDTPLHLAAQGGFSDVVNALLESKDSGVDVRNKRKETALFKAYESGNLETVEALFKAYPPSLLKRTADKRTCLTVAVNRGDSGNWL